jgi:beta-glucosidase
MNKKKLKIKKDKAPVKRAVGRKKTARHKASAAVKGFPKDFVWGVATSAFQIEGATREHGRGASVWDVASQQPGVIWNGQNADTACDHYHRYKKDVALMKAMGLKAYRMSVAWPRILPEGFGRVNSKGLDFYDLLTDELLAAGITPYVTLFHWDLPYELFQIGGWINKLSSDWFAEYVGLVAKKISDRVHNWITISEPQCFLNSPFQVGRPTMGNVLNFKEILQAAHHVLLAHGKAVQTIRSFTKGQSSIGISPAGIVKVPATASAADIAAARSAMFTITEKSVWLNSWLMDPIYLGKYPEEGLELFADDFPVINYHDLEIINQPLDFFSVNNYHGELYGQGSDGRPVAVSHKTSVPLTAAKFWVLPEALYWGPKFYWERYQLPLVITENGLSNPDWVHLDGQVHDPQRIDYMTRNLRALHRAMAEGVEVQGYFPWTLMDNFEWREGYKERYGLIYIDFTTQQRILKDSAHWYKRVIATNGEALFK